MAYYVFAQAIAAGEPITLYDEGRLRRDFTYIDDVVTGVLGCLDRPPAEVPPVRVLNIGNHHSEPVSTLVRLLEQALGRAAVIRNAPRPRADVEETFAAIERIAALTGFAPRTSLAKGIPRFVAWFRDWHGIV
jgi:UDP-glucuronate 4-epimerase